MQYPTNSSNVLKILFTNQSRMLSSILDRDYRRIVIDRIVTVDSNNIPTLHTNPDDILKIAPTQFRALTHPRQHQFDSLTPEWVSIYSPLQHVNDNIYQSLELRTGRPNSGNLT